MIVACDIEKKRKYDRERAQALRKKNPEYYKRQLEANKLKARERYTFRRYEFFGGRSCALCDSTSKLEAHHIDRSTKESSYFWNWSEVRYRAEISKCIALCHVCHKEYHRRNP